MIGNAFKLIKSRKDPEAAKAIAVELLKEEVKAKTDGAIFAVKLVYVGLITLFLMVAILSAYGGMKLSGLFYILTGLSCVVLFALFKAYTIAKARIFEAQIASAAMREKLPELLRKQNMENEGV